MPDLYLDLTELLTNPIRTGIQRVEVELIKWWPKEVPFRIAKFNPSRGMIVLSEGASDCVRRLFTTADAESDRVIAELKKLTESPDNLALEFDDENTRLVVPELFYDGARIAYYSSLNPRQMKRTFLLVFDLLPLTHPAYFVPMIRPEITCAYFHLIRRATRVAFISKTTKSAFYDRLRRSPDADGPAFYLGSDGLGTRPQSPPPPFPVFSVVGTIEPRKNHAVIFEAFRTFQKRRSDAQLRFYGSMGWCAPQLRDAIASTNGRCGFKWVDSPSDVAMREAIIESTATIYASSAEGFGLPPVESLWLGTPVVAPQHIPSLENLHGAGIVALDSVDEDSLVAAMRTVSKDADNNLLREQARHLDLPTWKSFAREFSQWVQA